MKHMYKFKLYPAVYGLILQDCGNGYSEVITVAEEDDFACLEVRFNNGRSRYFLLNDAENPEETFFYELDFLIFYALVSIHSRATSLQRKMVEYGILPEGCESYPEELVDDFYAHCMMVVGKCKGCEIYDHCGGYNKSYLNECPLRWCNAS